MTQTASERAALVKRIRALSRFTEANGCTETEAQAALAKVQELISAHNIRQDELSIREEGLHCTQDEFTELNSSVGDWMDCGLPIAALYNTKVWVAQRIEDDPLGLGLGSMRVAHMRFFGFAADVAASVATAAIICNAVNAESSRFKGHRPSFRAGMIARLCQRLRDMKPKAAQSTGRGLIVLKDQLVTEQFAKLNLHLRNVRATRTTAHNSAAYAAGQAAGNGVNLGRAAQLSQGQRRLEGR